MKILVLAAAAALGLALSRTEISQEGKTPGPQHEMLRQFEGDWETCSTMTHPNGKAHVSTGTEADALLPGGCWITFTYRSTKDDKPFLGHGVIGFDPAKMKYVGIWVDSVSPHLMTYEGQCEASGKKLSMETSGLDPKTGKVCRGRLVWEFKDKDHRTLTFYKLDDSGSETREGDIQYTRKTTQTP